MKESIFKDRQVTHEEARTLTKEILALDQKVLDDIRASMLHVLEGYYKHINFAHSLVQAYGDDSNKITLHDGLTPSASRDAHAWHIKEFEDVLVSLGVLRQQDRTPGRFVINFSTAQQTWDEPITDF